ncbi:MAG: hypothetical protein U9R48_08910 [Chloroflexota bacterium]|nr:hypothetical protein [Chloroflexota bacterium]
MDKNPGRVAWITLASAFFVFCFVITAVPLSIRHHMLHAEEKHEAVVESLVGTVIVEPPVGRGSFPLESGESMQVPEGSVVRVDETSEAVITFFEHSFARLFPGTTVRLERMRSPRYRVSKLPNTVYVKLSGGHVHVGTTLSSQSPLDFRVLTLHADVFLSPDGSYALEGTNNRSGITVYARGGARVEAAGDSVELEPRQRTEVALGQPPGTPVDAARNLVVNGDFSAGFEGWRLFNDQGNDGGKVDGTFSLVVDEGRRAVGLLRDGGLGNHCETILEQTIDRTIPEPVSSLVVRATVKVRYQSLSGGGYLSSEYPLMIRITYRDSYDSETEWVKGFYYQNVQNNPTAFGLRIPQDRWYFFQSENLLESLPIRPYRILRLRVYAAGWDYESLISDINLIVE